eukprot:19623-Heterococcus_DN1.PRE.1
MSYSAMSMLAAYSTLLRSDYCSTAFQYKVMLQCQAHELIQDNMRKQPQRNRAHTCHNCLRVVYRRAGPLASTTVGNACALLYTPVVSAYQQLACTSAQCYQHVVFASKQQQRRVHTGRASSLIMLLALLLPSMQCLANAVTIITSSTCQSLSASPQYQWNVPPFCALKEAHTAVTVHGLCYLHSRPLSACTQYHSSGIHTSPRLMYTVLLTSSNSAKLLITRHYEAFCGLLRASEVTAAWLIKTHRLQCTVHVLLLNYKSGEISVRQYNTILQSCAALAAIAAISQYTMLAELCIHQQQRLSTQLLLQHACTCVTKRVLASCVGNKYLDTVSVNACCTLAEPRTWCYRSRHMLSTSIPAGHWYASAKLTELVYTVQ